MARMYPRQLLHRVVGLLTVLFALAAVNAHAAWTWQNPLPQGNQLNDAAFIDGTTGYAVGIGGLMLRTSDRGNSWMPVSSGTTWNLNRIVFVTQDSAWIFGDHGTILWSIDGGMSWRAQISGTTANLYDAAFADHFNGFVVGASGTILRTSSAGVNWSASLSGVMTDLHGISVVSINGVPDINHVWVVGFAGTVLNTIDGGASWTPHSGIPATDNLYACWFESISTGWVGGDNGLIWHTRTTGASWLTDNNQSYEQINRFTAGQASFVVGACNGNNVIVAFQDDSNWTAITSHLADVNLYGISENIVDDTGAVAYHYYMAGPKGVVLTLDLNSFLSEGSIPDMWTLLTPGTRTPLYSVTFTGNTAGYAVGDSGILFRTNDGVNWWPMVVYPGGLFRAIAFNPHLQSHGIMVGESGLVFWTTDAGNTWTRDFSTVLMNKDWFSVSYSPDGAFYIGGQAGTVARHTSNTVMRPDTDWTALVTPTNRNVYSIYIADQRYGYIGCAGGQLFKTTDAGSTWNAQNPGTNQDIYALQVFHGLTSFNGSDSIENSNGFVLGNTGLLRRTVDGGVHWMPVDVGQGTNTAFKGLRFLNQLEGVIVGTNGMIFKTVDGGNSWMQQPTPTKQIFNSVFVVNMSTAWAVGENGMVMFNGDVALPVELSSFQGWQDGNGARLTWTTASELNSTRFELERRSAGDDWMTVGQLNTRGTASEPQTYVYNDPNLKAGTYTYRLKQVDNDGSFRYEATEVEVTIGTPTSMALYQNYPNPFNPTTRIAYDLKTSGLITLDVYSMLGQQVASIANGVMDAGHHEVTFDASTLPSGVYEYRLNVNGSVISNRMTLLK